MEIQKISVCILTKNSEKYLVSCLESLRDFSEIIILDNGSEDNTIAIAESFHNTKIIKHDFIGFGPLKNLAAEKAKNDWILSIDSDEILSYDLLKSIKHLNADERAVYSFPRENHYNGKLIKCCGWYPDLVLRLYNKKITEFNQNLVHESIITKDLDIKRLKGSIAHYTFDSVEELVDKMQRYSTLYAQDNKNKKSSSPWKAFSHASFAFIRNYFLKKGIFYGYEGFLISVCNSLGVFFKYIKLYEENKR